MLRLVLPAMAAFALTSCDGQVATSYEPQPYVEFENAEWTRDAVIYQMNTRQFTKEGTFSAAQEHLPRLAEMGVDIVWLMPIHPIGEVNRKGGMGSPYSVLDYRAVNPDLGTAEEFRAFVDKAHDLGLKVILDWVANHSAWDNPLIEEHPEWYLRTPEGDPMPPEGTDWSDVIDFDYSQPGLREYMTGSLAYWVREFDVDGYRADVAGYVPTDFWETARKELNAIKPVFMLAEWETRDLHRTAFDATYGWGWKEAMQELVADGSGAGAMRGYFAAQNTTWPRAAYRMNYTDNHDQNSWDGVASRIYGQAYQTAMALSFVSPGIPLIYNGQEADLDRQLSFFEKDEIEWREGRYDAFLRELIALKTQERALWNGRYGAPVVDVPNSANADILSFVRGEGADRIFAVFNLSPRAHEVTFDLARHHGNYSDAISDEPVAFDGDTQLTLGPWDFRILRAD
ncbi:MAG: alpha-amylase family glycosyl hydrolase [Pseudomonadota bacterium]|nr:alpha-amylase family glycosyl hydrolase [Pseudomonadota bacterium]